MLLIPPIVINPTRIAINVPITQCILFINANLSEVTLMNWLAAWLIWIMFPPVIAPPIQRIENITARGCPNQRKPLRVKPCAM